MRLAGPAVMPLYPSEREIARAVLGEEHAKEWPEKAIVLERKGLPKVDVLMGGRCWEKVVQFFHRAYEGIDDAPKQGGTIPGAGRIRIVPFPPDGPEFPDAENETPASHRRTDRRTGRARS